MSVTTAFPARGLYVITATPAAGLSLESAVAGALDGGACAVQYRDKRPGGAARRRREATALLALCRARQVPLIVNDDVNLAADIGADGVHLGADDASLATARDALGPEAIVGVSCYNRPERALAAQDAGATYVAFGRFFPSGTKPAAVQATPSLLREVRPRLGLPVVAIGGITPENGALLMAAGADLLAVIGGVFGHADPRVAARAFETLF